MSAPERGAQLVVIVLSAQPKVDVALHLHGRWRVRKASPVLHHPHKAAVRDAQQRHETVLRDLCERRRYVQERFDCSRRPDQLPHHTKGGSQTQGKREDESKGVERRGSEALTVGWNEGRIGQTAGALQGHQGLAPWGWKADAGGDVMIRLGSERERGEETFGACWGLAMTGTDLGFDPRGGRRGLSL